MFTGVFFLRVETGWILSHHTVHKIRAKIVLRRDFERNRVMNALRTESPASILENELI